VLPSVQELTEWRSWGGGEGGRKKKNLKSLSKGSGLVISTPFGTSSE